MGLRRIPRWPACLRALAAFAVALVVVLPAAATGPEADPEASVDAAALRSGGLVGLRAPTCELASLAPGDAPARMIAFGRAAPGRVTLVDFWASWCPTCEHAFGFLDALARELGEAGLDVVAVNLDGDPQDAIDFLAHRRIAFEVMRDATGNCPRGFGLVGMPSAYLIDGSGRVRALTLGFRAGEAKALRREIEALLAPGRDTLPAVAAGHAAR